VWLSGSIEATDMHGLGFEAHGEPCILYRDRLGIINYIFQKHAPGLYVD